MIPCSHPMKVRQRLGLFGLLDCRVREGERASCCKYKASLGSAVARATRQDLVKHERRYRYDIHAGIPQFYTVLDIPYPVCYPTVVFSKDPLVHSSHHRNVATMGDSSTKSSSSSSFGSSIYYGILLCLTWYVLSSAYRIRLRAIETFGPVIHEFDPYFNYRATEVCAAAQRAR